MEHGSNSFVRFAIVVALALPTLAQEPAQVPAPAPERRMFVLGEAEQRSVVLGDVQTILDVMFAAKARKSAAWDRVVLLRPADDSVLLVAIDVLKMVKTGQTKDNVAVSENDVLVVPNKDAAAGKQDATALVTDDVLAQMPARNRALVLVWCIENTKDAKRLLDCVVELAKLGEQGRVGCRALAAKLEGDAALAREAATALGMLGAAAAPALPALRKSAESGDKQVAARSVAAIRAIEAAVAKRKAAEPPKAK